MNACSAKVNDVYCILYDAYKDSFKKVRLTTVFLSTITFYLLSYCTCREWAARWNNFFEDLQYNTYSTFCIGAAWFLDFVAVSLNNIVI